MRAWLADPAAAFARLPKRIRDKIRRTSPRATACWLWIGARHCDGVAGDGYGRVCFKGKNRLAHHVVTEIVLGEPRPRGKVQDHVFERCTSAACVRPDHGEYVTPHVNGVRAAEAKRVKRARMAQKLRANRVAPEDLEAPF
jgi:hypothetical protein